MVNKTIVNKKQASIIPLLWRGRGRGEKQNASCSISRGLPTVFHVIDNAPREPYGVDYVSTNISSLRDGNGKYRVARYEATTQIT
ncbi:MAG: hypothetical protein LBC68_12870 [Prevotellaceae bacterium]|nr:hypothetical protein [Prevotellaceae bacterium]